MMQSILMTPSSATTSDVKATKAESNADLKKGSATADNEKSPFVFSKLLEAVLDDVGKTEGSVQKEDALSDTQSSTDITEDLGATDADKETSDESIEIEGANEDTLLLQGSDMQSGVKDSEDAKSQKQQKSADIDASISDINSSDIKASDIIDVSTLNLNDSDNNDSDTEASDTLASLLVSPPASTNQSNIKSTDAKLSLDTKNTQNVAAQGGMLNAETSRLLEKIETAQKMNPKVTTKDMQGKDKTSSAENVEKASFNTLLKSDKKTSAKENEVLSALLEKAINKDEKEKDKTGVAIKAQIAVNALEIKDKQENPGVFKTDLLHNVINTDNDLNKNKHLSSLDKLTNISIVNDKQNSLEKPFELHAKQAADMLGKRLLMMIHQGKQEVSIRLDPAELGSMHIKLVMQQDQLQLYIQTQHVQSRDLIEQHLPKLREQLAQQGINLNTSNVEQQSHQQNQQQQQSLSSHHQEDLMSASMANMSLLSDEQISLITTKTVSSAQGIDFYA
ncbi:hypothetical protein JI57_00720 [Psychromonas sp. PRT-SC03]|nr:hypothetical protein JI57_00720 [Psychromonas sp. PRT-SC03]